jgi:hypothetical protein
MDVRRELAAIRKHYREYQQKTNEFVVWFEFTPFGTNVSTQSVYDDVYDEGIPGTGGRRYKAGVTIPVLLVTEAEDTKRAIPEGRQPVQLTNIVGSVQDFRDAGVTDPFEYQQHLNDMFFYDGRYYSVASYKVRGRAQDDVLVVVEGIEIYLNQEFLFDVGPGAMGTQNLPWPSSLPVV